MCFIRDLKAFNCKNNLFDYKFINTLYYLIPLIYLDGRVDFSIKENKVEGSFMNKTLKPNQDLDGNVIRKIRLGIILRHNHFY